VDRISVEVRFFAHVQTGAGAHPASCTMGTGSFPGVKRPGLNDHTLTSSAEVTKGWGYTSIHRLGQFRPVTGMLYLSLYPSLLQAEPTPGLQCGWRDYVNKTFQ
jgi:hypothetical protein